MAAWLLLMAFLAVGSVIGLRVLRARHRRRLREARRRRRAEQQRQWEKMTCQFLGDDWQS